MEDREKKKQLEFVVNAFELGKRLSHGNLYTEGERCEA